MTGFRRVRHRAIAGFVGLAAVVSLSGCVGDLAELLPTPEPTPSGHAGQLSRDQAETMIEQIPGIESAEIMGAWSGWYYDITARLSYDDPSALEDPVALEYLFRVLWAQTNAKPTGAIRIPENESEPVDLRSVAETIFDFKVGGGPGYGVNVSSRDLTQLWGGWPGAIPEVPDRKSVV